MPSLFPDFASARIKTSGTEIFARVAGDGPPLLLLHGYPQTHAMWHRVAPVLARDFTVVLTDLRGYGDSGKPSSGHHSQNYSKRAMAMDQIEVMEALGFKQFMVAGHDRGARVAHRMALDHADRVSRLALLDIVPTRVVFEKVDQETAMRYFHWFFLSQPHPLPERMISEDPERWLKGRLAAWSRTKRAFAPHVVADYLRCFSQAECIRATCDDYRAAAGIDLEHDRENGKKLAMPLLLLWGEQGFVGRHYDVVKEWEPFASQLQGQGLPCGHFLPEEQPQSTSDALTEFFLEAVTVPLKRAQPSVSVRRAAA